MNKLEYLFGLVQEEACEIGQAASKCNRFTPGHAHYEHSNLERLQIEITDLVTVLTMIEEEINNVKVEGKPKRLLFEYEPSEGKRQRLLSYMNISREMGCLKDE